MLPCKADPLVFVLWL